MSDLLAKFDATVSRIRQDLEANQSDQDRPEGGHVFTSDADPDSEDLTCALVFVWGASAKHFCGRFLRDPGVVSEPRKDSAESSS